MGAIKDLWTRIESGETVYESKRLPGKLPRGTKWVLRQEGWTLARKDPEELKADATRTAARPGAAPGEEELKRLYLTKSNYAQLEPEELLHIQRWINEMIDQKKEAKRKALADRIAVMQRELSNLK